MTGMTFGWPLSPIAADQVMIPKKPSQSGRVFLVSIVGLIRMGYTGGG